MKVSRILGAYLLYAIIYFTIANLLFESDVDKEESVFLQILNSIANALYWMHVCFYFLLSVFVSGLIGMYLSRANRQLFFLFRNICITALAVFILAVIASYF